jgi:hypothetical protein
MFNPKISVFRSLFNSKETPFTLEAIEVYNRIKQGNPELIGKIKKLRAGDTDSKMQLMAIMFNGTFSERKDDGLIKHSGLCVLDFDKYPDAKTMAAERNRLKDCPYVYMMFTSPSGNGLKVVIRTPESTKFEHKRRFEAYKEYINSDYFDVANSNVSRVCFESYDPEAYLNEFCEVFQGITQDKGYHKAEKIAVLPIANEDRIIELIMKFNHGKFEEGRNNWTFKVACTMCEYGVDQYAAKNYLLQYAQEEGRRIILSENGRGYKIVNYLNYRDIKSDDEKREYMRQYMKRRRDKTKENDENVNSVNPCKVLLNDVTHTEAEAEADTKKNKKPSFDDTFDFCNKIGLTRTDAEYMHDKWLETGFKNNGKPIKDWQAQIRNWKRMSYLPSTKQKPAIRSTNEPSQLRSFP